MGNQENAKQLRRLERDVDRAERLALKAEIDYWNEVSADTSRMVAIPEGERAKIQQVKIDAAKEWMDRAKGWVLINRAAKERFIRGA